MKKWLMMLLMVIVLGALTACGDEESTDTEASTDTGDNAAESVDTDEEEAGPALQVLSDESAGEYLADEDGMTLYYFKNDVEGKSNCTDDCLANWPSVKAADYKAPDGYDQEDFGSIQREDNGDEQLTYKGYPLYYFAKDKAQGDVNGEGLKDVWYIVNSETEFGK